MPEQVTIPAFAKKLDELYLDNNPTLHDKNSTISIENLIAEMHRAGVNFRYLGLLRTQIKSNELRSFLLTEIVARVVKNFVRREMRKLKSSEELDYIRALVDTLNDIFGSSSGSAEFWKFDLSLLIERKYPKALTDNEKALITSYETGTFLDIQWRILLYRLQTLLGVKFKERVLQNTHLLQYPSQLLFVYEVC